MLVGGMVAIGTKKMSAKNAQAIEEHTGMPPEELEDADLEEAMQELGKSYEVEIYEGAGHGFLRAQADREGANMRATEQGWARTVSFFREHLGG